jgi:isoleucyl-tRNA synthetase
VSNLELEAAMQHIRTLATLGRAAREDAAIKVRQPLAKLLCVIPHTTAETAATGAVHDLVPLLAAELNVKEVVFASSADNFVTLEAKANFRALGKRFGKSTPLAAAAISALPSDALQRFEHGEPLGVTVGNESHPLFPDDLTIVRRATGDLVVKEEGGYFAAIDTTLTPELRREGIARELVSRIQRLRKELDFAVSDRVHLGIYGDDEVCDAATTLKDWIAGEVLARDVHIAARANAGHATHRFDLDGLIVDVALTRIA